MDPVGTAASMLEEPSIGSKHTLSTVRESGDAA